MKVSGNGQGKILTPEELRLLFTEGLRSPRDKALEGICLFTGCRVSEALALQTTDIKSGTLTFRKSTTKGKLKTRVVDIQPALAQLLADHQPRPGALFPFYAGSLADPDSFYGRQDSQGCLSAGGLGGGQHSQLQENCPYPDG